MYTLFHNPISTCSQKVRWVFSEKGIDYTSREIDLLAGEQHADWYIKLNPKHVVPTLVHDDAVLCESSLIMMYLDDVGGADRLAPDDAYGAHQMRSWMHLIDHTIHNEAAIVTFSLGPRRIINEQPAEVRDASISRIVDPTARAQRRSVLDHGVNAPEFQTAIKHFMKMLSDMDAALRKSAWLAGDGVTLADGAVLPYVLRLEHLGLDDMLIRHAAVSDWLARMKERGSFDDAIARWIPDFGIAFMKERGPGDQEAIQALLTSLEDKKEAAC